MKQLNMCSIGVIEDTQEVLYAIHDALFNYVETLIIRTNWKSLQNIIESKGIPDLVILDLNLAYVSGFEIASQLRKHEYPPKLVCLTASVIAETIERAKPLFDSFISKPFDDIILRETLTATLNGESRWIHGIDGTPI